MKLYCNFFCSQKSLCHSHEITKPEGEKRNIMRMTQADWYKILFEIAGNLYSFGG